MDWSWVSLQEVNARRQSGVMADPWEPRLDALCPMASIIAADEKQRPH